MLTIQMPSTMFGSDDALAAENVALIRKLSLHPDFKDLEKEELENLAQELIDHGITEWTFDDVYCGDFSSEWNQEVHFTRELIYDLAPYSCSEFLESFGAYLDFQAIWDCDLRHDYINVQGYFFRNV